MAKLDLRKQLKHLYAARKTPVIVDVPEMNYLMIDGKGDPNTSEDFRAAMETLFGVSYGAKFTLKKRDPDKDYAVMGPEGLWWAEDVAAFAEGRKDEWLWTLMIMQPEFVTSDLVEEVAAAMREKGKGPALDKMRLAPFEEGKCVQVLHVGPYDTEGASVEKMLAFAGKNGLEFCGKHHEIYLSDARRVPPERWKTMLRHPVCAKACDCPGRQIQGMY